MRAAFYLLSCVLLVSSFACSSTEKSESGSESGGGSTDTSTDLVPSFSLVKTATVKSGGSIWSIPVTDGTSIYVSTESGGTIFVEKFDQDLNFISESTVATASDVSTCTVPNSPALRFPWTPDWG